ncbi:hypothetical protein FKM82_002211 [Ascaphus truei]
MVPMFFPFFISFSILHSRTKVARLGPLQCFAGSSSSDGMENEIMYFFFLLCNYCLSEEMCCLTHQSLRPLFRMLRSCRLRGPEHFTTI